MDKLEKRRQKEFGKGVRQRFIAFVGSQERLIAYYQARKLDLRLMVRGDNNAARFRRSARGKYQRRLEIAQVVANGQVFKEQVE